MVGAFGMFVMIIFSIFGLILVAMFWFAAVMIAGCCVVLLLCLNQPYPYDIILSSSFLAFIGYVAYRQLKNKELSMPVRIIKLYYCNNCSYKVLHTQGDVLPPLPPSICPKCKQGIKSKLPKALDLLDPRLFFYTFKKV
ncbi:hypothetical protein LS71_007895 [Helicobacter jaachi]|uniref:Uncharacterized protein n=1 Tax=Helicobacter jaachi TaxID=1677920 RepID=A0A4U8T822_9HELI|nr:hypothetical protein [Helicobacter jaachi]TLD95755.1 hypothetical protein LS71_007895 [Helicobacter jaachi]